MALNTTESIEKLAAEIGENVYLDIAKWHLYLSNAHLHTLLAEQLYPILSAKSLDEDRVLHILQSIAIKIGGGKKEVSLIDFMPMQCQVILMDILEKYQRNM